MFFCGFCLYWLLWIVTQTTTTTTTQVKSKDTLKSAGVDTDETVFCIMTDAYLKIKETDNIYNHYNLSENYRCCLKHQKLCLVYDPCITRLEDDWSKNQTKHGHIQPKKVPVYLAFLSGPYTRSDISIVYNSYTNKNLRLGSHTYNFSVTFAVDDESSLFIDVTTDNCDRKKLPSALQCNKRYIRAVYQKVPTSLEQCRFFGRLGKEGTMLLVYTAVLVPASIFVLLSTYVAFIKLLLSVEVLKKLDCDEVTSFQDVQDMAEPPLMYRRQAVSSTSSFSSTSSTLINKKPISFVEMNVSADKSKSTINGAC